MTKIDLITRNLVEHLHVQIEKSSSIFILTSFVMKSGVEVLKESLKRAAERGADIKICTGDYLFITQPDALKSLINIHKNIEVRLWRSNGTSFHPKSYIFQSENDGVLVVGSSNLSRSALTSGIEWNLSIDASNKNETFLKAINQFSYHFLNENTVRVNLEIVKLYHLEYEYYHKKNPSLVKAWTQREELELMLPHQKPDINYEVIKEETTVYGDIKPRYAQVEALEELEKTLEEDYSSALVVMATGLGKTYLAGFFARNFKRILFIAHREEILYQAQNSFDKIISNKTTGVFNGSKKEGDADIVFASIYTLCMKHHLENFSDDEFDLIIVDEFHHAAADSYQRVIDYFNPRFLLGITATPDRNDNKDVYAICAGNVAYRIDFLEAIQRQWLAPFRYYGVYDETDYSQITWLGTRYSEDELLQVQLREEMAENILQSWVKHKQTRTIVFCSSIKQSEFLSSYFNKNGYKTVAVHSQQQTIGRKQAITMLEDAELDAIFTVDLFNEGVDIPSVDTLLFVRPTESLTVFTQQIGRGLRLHPDKESCVIIDLIGNYRNADIKLSLFDTQARDKKRLTNGIEPTLPKSCSLNLEVKVINLLKELAKKRKPRKEKLLQSYKELKITLGNRPTYLDLHLKGETDASQYKSEFKSFVGFLYWANELSDKEQEVYKRYEQWLIEVEKTGMAKSYKMVVLLAMLSRGVNHWIDPITPEEVAPFFHRYLTEKEYRKNIDFSDGETKRLWEYDEAKVAKLISKMPMTKWSGSSKGLVTFNDNQFVIGFEVLQEDLELLYNWTREICEYRLHYHFERKAKK